MLAFPLASLAISPSMLLAQPAAEMPTATASAAEPAVAPSAFGWVMCGVAAVAATTVLIAVIKTWMRSDGGAAVYKQGSEGSSDGVDDGPDYVPFVAPAGTGSRTGSSTGSPAVPGVVRFESRVCEHCKPLRHETNVIVLHRLGLLQKLVGVNLALALASIAYFAVSLVLLVISLWPEEHVVDSGAFHLLDFGGAFVFSLIEVLTLLYSPERRFSSPALLRCLMFFSVCSTSVALLFTLLNRSKFEVTAHNINYVNDFVIALVDSLLVSTVVRSPARHPGRGARHASCGALGTPVAVLATLVPLSLSFGQVALYNGLGADARGHMLGERPAHWLEFVFTMVGAAINFWFCLDSRMLAEELTRQIMIAPDEFVVVIDPTSNTSVHTADECGRSPASRAEPGALECSGCAHEHDHALPHAHQHVHDHACAHANGRPRKG